MLLKPAIVEFIFSLCNYILNNNFFIKIILFPKTLIKMASPNNYVVSDHITLNFNQQFSIISYIINNNYLYVTIDQPVKFYVIVIFTKRSDKDFRHF